MIVSSFALSLAEEDVLADDESAKKQGYDQKENDQALESLQNLHLGLGKRLMTEMAGPLIS